MKQSSIVKEITNKFPSDYALAGPLGRAGALALALANNKRDAFWKRYDTDKAFKNRMNNSYAYKKRNNFDFWLPWDELRKYLKPELQSAELLLIEENKVSSLKTSDVSDVLKIAENIEEFQRLVLEKYSAITNIWFELERKLERS